MLYLPKRRTVTAQAVTRHVALWVLLLTVTLLVLAPIAFLVVTTFRLGTIGQYHGWGLDVWRDVLSSPRLGSALWNTIALSFTRQLIGLVLGIGIAWLLARTDLPGRGWLEFGFWIAVFLPGLTVTLSWIFLLDPVNGVVNQWLLKLPFVDSAPFNIYSWWGIVWVHLVTGSLPVKVMLLTPAMRALDSSLEEAARASGDTTWGTLRRVVLPVMMPTVLVVLVLGFIRAFESFEIELILGTPARIEVLSSLVYNLARDMSPPQYGHATVVSLIAVAIMLPAILVQQRYGSKYSVSTIGSHFRSQPRRLGRLRWPLFTLVFGAVLILTVTPGVALIVGTFTKLFGVFTVSEPWTLNHWRDALSSPLFWLAFRNSNVLAVVTMVLALVLFTTIAHVVVRSRFRARGTLDFFAWFPSIIPGVVLGLGYLWVFLNTPGLRSIYGTTWILVLVTLLASMTLTVQIMKTSLRQLGHELEEVSWASGASRFETFRRITLPLVAPTLVVVGVTAFSVTARTTSHVALLSTSQNQPLSILQLNQMADHAYGPASVIGVFILAITLAMAFLARMLGYKTL